MRQAEAGIFGVTNCYYSTLPTTTSTFTVNSMVIFYTTSTITTTPIASCIKATACNGRRRRDALFLDEITPSLLKVFINLALLIFHNYCVSHWFGSFRMETSVAPPDLVHPLESRFVKVPASLTSSMDDTVAATSTRMAGRSERGLFNWSCSFTVTSFTFTTSSTTTTITTFSISATTTSTSSIELCAGFFRMSVLPSSRLFRLYLKYELQTYAFASIVHHSIQRSPILSCSH